MSAHERAGRRWRRSCWLGAGVAAVLGCAGCVVQPTSSRMAAEPAIPDTTVYFYGTAGQSAEQRDRDKYECNGWAVRQSGFDPSAPSVPPHLRYRVVGEAPPPGSGVAFGAIAGALIGAALSDPWESGRGAVLGAMAGAAMGGVAEASAAEQARERSAAGLSEAQAAAMEQGAMNYRRAMSACLAGRGYTVR